MTPPLRLAVFGQPVTHSLSPAIHQAFGHQFGIDLDYQPIETPAGTLPRTLEAFRSAGGQGANLTVPLKTEGLACCSWIQDAARRAGAVNTLAWQEGQWRGFNTDGQGLVDDLQRLGQRLAGKRILIIGAGGATAGILGALLEARPAGVVVINRSPEPVERLIRLHDSPVLAGGGLGAADSHPPFDLIVQATSQGHQGRTPTLVARWLAPDAAAYDLNYGTAHQPFASECARHDLPCHDGLGMLVSQAAGSFEIWTGKRPEILPVLSALRYLINRMAH